MRLPPGPPGLPFLGNFVAYARDPLAFPARCARDYGDVVRIRLPGFPTYLFRHPDDVERILVKDSQSFTKDKFLRGMDGLLGRGLLVSEGELWRRQRRLAQPAFHHQRIRAYADVMAAHAARAFEAWRPGEERDVHGDFMRLTLGIVGDTLFGTDVSEDAAAVGECMDVLTRHYLGFFETGLRVPERLPTPSNLRFRRAVRRLDEILYRLIAARRQSGGQRTDLLALLLAAQDDDGHGMDDRQLRDEVVTLFLAGHETTALTLTFAAHLLAHHPAAARRLEREVDEVLAGRAPAFEDLARLGYTDAVVAESMRLYPPAWALGREAVRDCEVGGYFVPKGTQIWILPWLNHRDARWFEAPDEFRPERWEDGLARRLPRFAYFPFGGGPRICIGNAFAKAEAVILLAALAQRWSLAPRSPAKLELVPTITLRPKGGVRVALARRGP